MKNVSQLTWIACLATLLAACGGGGGGDSSGSNTDSSTASNALVWGGQEWNDAEWD